MPNKVANQVNAGNWITLSKHEGEDMKVLYLVHLDELTWVKKIRTRHLYIEMKIQIATSRFRVAGRMRDKCVK